MSCRDKYNNYGSYVRNRGNEKALCDVIKDIEDGKRNIGPFEPISGHDGNWSRFGKAVVFKKEIKIIERTNNNQHLCRVSRNNKVSEFKLAHEEIQGQILTYTT